MDDQAQIEEKRRIRAEKKNKLQQQQQEQEQEPKQEQQQKTYLHRKLKTVPSTQQDHQDGTPNRIPVKIMTWNILAQCLVRRTLFPGSDCLKWKDRGPAITQEIVEQDPDVVCLQEVDRLGDHGPVLEAAGYRYRHVIGGYEEDGKQHGLLVGWKSAKMELVGEEVIRLDEQADAGRVGLSRATRNVGLICALRFAGGGGGLVIGTVHLFWHPCFTYERARQTAFLSRALAGFPQRHGAAWPVFLAGDLNEQPGGAAYRLLTGAAAAAPQQAALARSRLVHRSVDALAGAPPRDYLTMQGDEDRVFKDVRPPELPDGLFDLPQLASIAGPHRWLSLYGSCAPRILGPDANRFRDRPGFLPDPSDDPVGCGHHEPMWTNFTPLWRCTLDYIWVLKREDAGVCGEVEVVGLLPTHRTDVLEPGLPRLGVEPSDHIALMALVLVPCP